VRVEWRRRELLGMLGAGLLVAIGLWQVYQSRSAALAEVEQGLAARKLLNLNNLTAREDLLPALSIIPDPRDREEAARKIYYFAGALGNVGGIRSAVSGEQFRALKPLFVVRTPARFRRAFFLWVAIFLAGFLAAHLWWSLRGFRGDQTLLPAALLLTGVGLILMVSLRDPVRDQLLFVGFAQGAAMGTVLLAALSGLDYERLFGRLSFVPLLASFVLSALLILLGRGPGTSDAKVNLFGFQPVEIIRILLVFFLAGYFATRWDVLRHARETRRRLAPLTRWFDIPPVEYTLPMLASVVLSLMFFFLQRDMGPALVFSCLFLVLYGLARGSAFVPVVGLGMVVGGFVVGYIVGVPHTVRERVSMWLSPWNNLVHGGDQLAHSLWAFSTGGFAGMGIGRGDPQLVPAGHTDLILSALGEELGFLGVAVVFALFALIVWRALRIARYARTDYEYFLAAGLGAATVLQILLISGGALGVLPLSGVVTPFLSYGRTAMLANFVVLAILESISARGWQAEAPLSHVRGSDALRAPGASRYDSGPRPSASEPRTSTSEPRTSESGASGTPAAAGRGLLVTGWIFAAAGLLVAGKAALVGAIASGSYVGQGTLVVEADGARRYQYNPRFQEIMREIPKGSIYDRNGLPLATSNWDELEKHRADYQALGVDIDRTCSRADTRHYPFGGLTFDLLGDLRTRIRWAASNTSYVERDSARRLRGYDDRPTLVEVKNPKTGAMDRVIRYDFRELVPLLRHRYDPQNPEVRRVLDRPRDVKMSIDARLQVKVADTLRRQLQQAKQDRGSAVVLDPASGDMLAAVSFPLPPDLAGVADAAVADAAAAPVPAVPETNPANPYLDRARYGLYPPGSTFKVVTAMAALRKDPALAKKTYECIRLPDGRVGNYIKGSNRPIRDDERDTAPHGTVDMEHGIVVSCNAYFAQLGTYDVGAQALLDTAKLLGIAVASPLTAAQLKKSLPQSSYGQGQVVVSPFQMARVAAAVAAGGAMPEGRWITDDTNARTNPPENVLDAGAAQTLGRFMREVVTGGTGRQAAASVPVAGKTGTAELADAPSHAWFIGYAPYGAGARKIAFSILVENGIYGGTAAAPAAAEIVNAAVKLGLIQP
jgi:cell division protein FtsW (lipid II flippase)